MKSFLRHLPLLGLVIVFVWFGIDKFLNPMLWIGWQPAWMEGFLGQTKDFWNQFFGVAEIVMAMLLVFPKTRFIGGLAMSAYLLPIIQIGWPGDIAVRDIGLLSVSLYYGLEKLTPSR